MLLTGCLDDNSNTTPMRQKLVLALSLALIGFPTCATTPMQQTDQAGQTLRALYEAEWEWRQQEFAREKIDGRWQSSDHLPTVTPGAWQRRAEYWQHALAQLDGIETSSLSRDEQINAAVFRTAVQAHYNNAIWRTYEAPFNSDTFFWGELNARQPYQTEAQWRRFISRIQDIPRYFDEHIANMRRGLARGWSVPRAALNGRDETIAPYTLTGEGNPFLATLERIPVSIAAPVRNELYAQGHRAVLEYAVPAYTKLLTFMRDEYLPQTRTSIAASDLPDGRAFYVSQIRDYVTREMSAKEIHEIGLREVARISGEMHTIMEQVNFSGSFAEFLQFLRTNPQFYAKTAHELLAEAAWISKKIDGELKHTIGVLPRYRFTILPVADDIAPVYTAGRGGLEACWFNTHALASRPLYNLPALTLHECIPGHSFQAALALEAPARAEFRQNTYFSGYGEGWGLYTEWLGTVMGIYETPYQEFGRLTFEMWRAARLVIDTGLHEYGWTRQQAIDYLASHTALAQLDIANEVDRYISWPGQALSYYIGYMTMRALRDEAERELGAAFDQRPFHDAILNLGSVPLPILEQEIRAFIAAQKTRSENAISRE